MISERVLVGRILEAAEEAVNLRKVAENGRC